MVVIACSVISKKKGTRLVTRLYREEMNKSRLLVLLDSFWLLIKKSFHKEKNCGEKQHNFIETDNIRYVYQLLENVYVVLLTTKASNIFEDLETLRLFSRVIPEYCSSNKESEILNKAFDLLFAFDEIVVLGSRVNINLAQVKTFIEMDSQEERLHIKAQLRKQMAAREIMKTKVKEIERAAELRKRLGQEASDSFGDIDPWWKLQEQMSSSTPDSPDDSALKVPKKGDIGGAGKAMKLGRRANTDDDFFEKIQCEEQ